MAHQIEARLGKLGEKRADLRKELLQTYRHQIKEKYRFLKGQPPERILWEIVSPENIEEIKDSVILSINPPKKSKEDGHDSLI